MLVTVPPEAEVLGLPDPLPVCATDHDHSLIWVVEGWARNRQGDRCALLITLECRRCGEPFAVSDDQWADVLARSRDTRLRRAS